MGMFNLQIVTLDGLLFHERVQKVIVRTIDGDVGICANHIPYVTAVGDGRVKIITGQNVQYAWCSGGVLCVSGDMVRIIAGRLSWEETA